MADIDLTFYTTRQVASILHCGLRTIRRYIHEGKFNGCVLCGKQYLIPHDSLVEYLNKHNLQKFAENNIS